MATVADRLVIVASADAELRQRLGVSLAAMRWQVSEALGGAEALALLEKQPRSALLLDAWLPDLHADELVGLLKVAYPEAELLRMDGSAVSPDTRSPRRHELLHALWEAQPESHAEVQPEVHANTRAETPSARPSEVRSERQANLSGHEAEVQQPAVVPAKAALPLSGLVTAMSKPAVALQSCGLDGMVGASAAMHELARLVRLVAPRSTTVLIEGETGTGKELVAQSVHKLSPRAAKPFVVLNCAAIPESLLEAELFGHARGAFTGAAQARTGRIEAAHGGTLFLDEIGEMQLGLQAKLLRFLESGELQRVGENGIVRVDVRIVAATHQDLRTRAALGAFRSDVYHRLAVFPLQVPALRERPGDIPLLIDFFLKRLAGCAPPRTLSAATLEVLLAYPWPGNVRELAHVMERATILADDAPVIGLEHIRLDRLIARRVEPAA